MAKQQVCQNMKPLLSYLIFYWTLSRRGPKLTIQRVKKTCATYFGHFSGFVFKICLWISIFGRKKQFENRIFSCWDIKQTKLLIFFIHPVSTLYRKLWKSAVCTKKKLMFLSIKGKILEYIQKFEYIQNVLYWTNTFISIFKQEFWNRYICIQYWKKITAANW